MTATNSRHRRVAPSGVRPGLLLPSIVSLALFLLPFLWLGAAVSMGGDGTRAYFAFPEAWLRNIALTSYGDLIGFGRYSQFQHFAPIDAVLTIISASPAPVNPEAFAFGICLAGGFFGTYSTIIQLLGQFPDPSTTIMASAGALFYVVCPLVATIYWSAPYEWPLAVGGVPILVALSLGYIESAGMTRLFCFSLTAAIYGAGIQVIPVSLPFLLIFIVAIKCIVSLHGIGTSAIRRIAILTVVFVASSAYWLAPLIASVFASGGIGRTALAAASTVEDTVHSVVVGQSMLYTFAAMPSFEFLRAFNWNTLDYVPWYRAFVAVNLLTLAIAIYSSLASRAIAVSERVTALCVLASALCLAYLQTVNVLLLGTSLFLLVSNHVPGSAMFRNFYGKFAGSYSFAFSIVLSLGLCACLRTLGRKDLRLVASWCFFALVALEGWPLLSGGLINMHMTGAPRDYTQVGRFSPSFWSAMSYIAGRDPSWRVVEFPFHSPPQSIYPMQPQSAIYVGDSLVRVFSGHEVFNSAATFQSGGSLDLPLRLDGALRERDYQTVGMIFRLTAVRLILFTTGVPPAIASHWRPSVPFPESSEDMTTLARGLGARLAASFADPGGGSWQVYELPEAGTLPRVFVTSDVMDYGPQAVSRRSVGMTDAAPMAPSYSDLASWLLNSTNRSRLISTDLLALPSESSGLARFQWPNPWRYEIEFTISHPSTLVVLEPYSPDWCLQVQVGPNSGQPTPPVEADGYAMGWQFPEPGRYVVFVRYRFQGLLWTSLAITVLTVLVLGCCATARGVGPIVANLRVKRVRIP